MRSLRLAIVSIIVFIGLLFGISVQAFNVAMDSPHSPESYADAVKLAAPSVVNIYTRRQSAKTDRSGRVPRSLEPYRDQNKYRLGSGVIMNEQGYILTNYHVIRRAKQILVDLDDGRKTRAKLIGSDPETDLAVIKINLKNLQPITLANSDRIHVGDVVLAIGNPFGLGQTVTQGIISAIGRNAVGINELENYIQTDAAINPGNSGGALINTTGHLIGINTGIYTRSGGYQGVGFAIPGNVAVNIMNQIIKYGKVKRGWLGIDVIDMNQEIAQRIGSKFTDGAIITEILPNTPGAASGLKVKDIITGFNYQRIRDARGLQNYVAHTKPGESVVLTLLRGDVRKQVVVKIGTRPPQPVIDGRGGSAPKREDFQGTSNSKRNQNRGDANIPHRNP